MRSFGEILKAQRQKLGFTQKQVADSVGVSDAYICELESDRKSPPPYHTVVVIADALQLDSEWLWKVAVKHREKQAVERSRRKIMTRRGSKGTGNDSLRQSSMIMVPDSQIEAFFELPEVRMTTFGLFHKQPKEMTMEEKRAVYQAINSVREFILERKDEPSDSP